ncbi:unnamed protein product [Phytophthora lilii]|uniref:Unnamed protein product n=1 Tax=Phytophthora lilii TaxID=2077276 RepID=A0A9W6WNR6_9STRA|nr:unnamed protein product [Phytophthora lilii]
MKVFAASFAATAVVASLPTTLGWWDNGHMLVGEVAKQLLDDADVTTIESVLSRWDEDFPNTGEITTTAVWMDLIKCTSVGPTCASPVSPSITSMSDWHYIDLPLNINGEKWEDKDADLTLFDDTMGGDGVSVIEGALKSFKTTKSKWAANLFLRNFIHIFGDLHQPLHTVTGISEAFPQGDGGGNSETFASPCAFSNLHAVWDAAGGLYSLNKWSLNIDSFKPTLQSNASELIALLPSIPDNFTFSQYENATYDELYTALVTNSVLRKVILETYDYANTIVYSNLDLNATSSGSYPCPSSSYLAMAGEISQRRIALAGSRLAHGISLIELLIRKITLDQVYQAKPTLPCRQLQERFTRTPPRTKCKPWQYQSRSLGAEDVEVKISHCGVCGSDVHTIERDWYPTPYPWVAGHEIVGHVTQVGPDVKGLAVGDRVGVGGNVWACLNKDPTAPCRFCADGQDVMCDHLVFTFGGTYKDGSKTYGGFSDYIRVDNNFAFKIPDNIPSDVAAPLLCAGVTVFTPLKQERVKAGDRVGVIEKEARELGAKEFYDLSNEEDRKKALGTIDYLLLTADGKDMPFDLYLSLLRKCGTLIIAGAPTDPIKIMPYLLVPRAIRSIQDTKDMLELTSKANVRPIIQKLPMSKINEGFDLVRNGTVRYRVVLEN